MKGPNYTLYFLLTTVLLILSTAAYTQSYKQFSQFVGGSGIDEVTDIQVINGETYLLGNTRSSNFPVTNASTYKGEIDIVLTRYNAAGNVLFSTYLGGRGNETVTSMQIVNGEIYLTGYTDSINFPVTNGSSFKGLRDVFVTKLNTNGDIVFSTYIGGAKSETPAFGSLEINGNDILIGGTTGSPDYPVTNSSSYHGGVSDAFVLKLNASNGAIISSNLFGGNNTDFVYKTLFENGDIYIIGSTFSTDIPVTIGNPINDNVENGFVFKVSGSTLNTIYSRYLGGDGRDFISTYAITNGILHLAGYTYSTDFPVTNGSTTSGLLYDIIDGFYCSLDTDGSIIFSTYITSIDFDYINDMVISNDDVYLLARAVASVNGEKNLRIFKINANGSFGYSKKFSLGLGNPGSLSFAIHNNDLYVSGITLSSNYTVTDGSIFNSGGSGFFTRLDPAGNIVYSGFLGKMNSLLPLQVFNNKFYLAGSSDLPSFPITDLSVIAGSTDNILIIKNTDGTNYFSGYLGGSNAETIASFKTDNTGIYFGGKTTSVNYPVTNNILYKANGDQYISKISFCPASYFFANDSLSPKSQMVCKFGLAEKITGVEVTVPSDSLPILYLNGLPTPQAPVKAVYQWQSAAVPAGPWTNIVSATFKDYTPLLGATDRYYRRLSFTQADCGSSLIHTSDTVSVQVNLLTAPVITPAGPFITCPGSAINIGGTPAVTGGNPPYLSYVWDMGIDSIANPSVNVNQNTLFTLIVTDAMGCKQIGQQLVITYRANAGPDKGACAGTPVRIGTAAIPGIPGTTYSWQPAIALTATNTAQPFSNPTVTTNYSLTVTLPRSDGGTCTSTDSVKVTPVAAPSTLNFAGADKVSCLADSILIGTPPEVGYSYTWSPGSYITGNVNSITYYYAGNIIMPVPNPAIMHLTAQKNGCTFSDETVIATIEARAGLDGCGPRTIGLPDRTPNINETYSWTKISGPGNFTGATDQPQVTVSNSIGSPTVYELTVSYNGGVCTDRVTVGNICSGCQTIIEVQAEYSCASYDVNGGNVTLIAFSSITNALYSWTPSVGLSNYASSVVQLTDNVPRIYTVLATDRNDSTRQCSFNIFVNDPAFSRPVFPAPDTATCIGVPVMIGLPPVAGYTYEWTGSGLSSNLISNPIANVSSLTSYPILVSDGNGCELKDTVLVAVQNAQVNAGPDWLLCSNGIVTLGTSAQPASTTYLWEPQASPWQNGTNQFSAQPQVFVATDIDFTVKATTSAGCITLDTVKVLINNLPSIPNAPDKFVCKGNSVAIGSPALPGVTYQWTPSVGLNNSSLAQPIATPTVTTIYTLTATFAGLCDASAVDQVTVTVGNAFFSMPDIVFCPSDGAVALGGSAPQNMISYSWQPQQLVNNPIIANPSTLNPPPGTSTNFTLLVTNTDGCSYRDTIALITSTPAPNAGIDKLICKGQATNIGSAGNATGPGISYSWNPTANLSNPSSPNPTFTGNTGGVFTYTLTVTNNNVSCSLTDIVVIRVIDSLIPNLDAPVICANSCVQIGTAPRPGYQYQWTPAEGLSDDQIANPVACLDSVTTSYTLTATDLNGCSASEVVVVAVSPLPAAQLTIPSVTACLGDTSITFNPIITTTGTYTYSWFPDNGTLSNIYSLTPQVMATNTGTTQYTLTITDMISGCSNSALTNLIINDCSQLAIVGDFVWYDANFNGLQDATEFGETGITVHLYNSADLNVGNTVTDGNGQYYFTNITPGNNYYVIFDLPAGYSFTQQNTGGITATNNSKANTAGRSNNFNILPGASILNIDAGIIPAGCGCGGPVPVTLLTFNGTLQNRQVFLNWQTSSEFNNDYFSLERSNATVFTAIGRINGNGTSSLLHNYSFIDQAPLNGVNYYRLKQIDFDGNYKYSHIIPIYMDNDLVVNAYYNSLNNSIRIIFNKAQNNIQLKLFGSNAQLVKAISTSANITDYTMQLPTIANGIYILQIIDRETVITKRLIIGR